MRLLILLLIASVAVSGAVIEGTVYDLSLSSVDKAVVEIDTTPRQVKVTSDGAYRFVVPKGQYSVYAESNNDYIVENISIVDEATYNVDLILLPNFEAEEAILESLSFQDADVDIPEDGRIRWVWFGLAGILILGVLLLLLRKKSPKDLDPDLKKILHFISKQGGRTTQKEIYKEFPWSESKVSLMLDDLEYRGLIRRVKKGRSNLVFRK